MAPLSTMTQQAEAMASPVRPLMLDPFDACIARREGGLVVAETEVAVRIGNLEERELHGAELEAELIGVRALADRDVLHQIPNVVVFLGRNPSVAPTVG